MRRFLLNDKYIKQKRRVDMYSREFLLRELQELQADFEDLSNEELIECRECMQNRVNQCLLELGECDEDNI